MAAQALWYRRWTEAWAWAALVLLFAVALILHLTAVAAQVTSGDLAGLSWFTMRGFEGWASIIIQSSHLRHLPPLISGPLMVLMVLGWAGWRTQIGTFGTLLFLGYGVALMIAGRENNWYWGLMIAPTMWLGLALAPMALSGLFRASFPGSGPA